MNIAPDRVTLTGWDTERFEVLDAGKPVPAKWSIEPSQRGIMTQDGVYTAPRWIFLQRTVVVIAEVATPAGQRITARVQLSNVRTWVLSVFTFLSAIGAALLLAAFVLWPRDPTLSSPLVIGPSSVVLTKDETFTFVASEPVEWSPNAPSGVFTATTGAGSDHVLATKTKGSDRTATAAVTVAETSLTIQPPLPTLHSGESMRLVARTSAKNPTWTGEICRSDGTCTAPDNLAEERIVTAKVSTSEPKLTASVAIRLVPTPPESKRLLLFAMLFGGLGGLLHAVNSLVAYVGSNTFVPRWGLFYVARPFVGAIIALFVFLVFKGQLSADTLKTTDVFAVAAIASIAGMFSDRAAEKLREIFDAVLGPKNDNRGDKLDPNAPTRPAAAPTPVITALDPAVLTVAQPGLNLTVKGTGFTDKCTATVNGQPRDVTFKSEAELLVTLETADVATQGNLEVVVANPSGAQSGPKSIAVQ